MTKDEFYARVNPQRLAEHLRDHPAPCYLFFADMIRSQVEALRACLPAEFDLYYAAKANPNPAILHYLAGLNVGGDVASLGEMDAVLAAGIPAERISFSGPGKTRAELQAALEHNIGSLNVESVAEFELVVELARAAGKKPRVGVRVNPDAKRIKSGLKMAGETPFGIAEAQLDEFYSALNRHADAVEFTGLHVHAGSQVLDAQSIVDNFQAIMDLGLSMERDGGVSLQRINFGGGWGITYFPNQKPLDLALLKQGLQDLFAREPYRTLQQRMLLLMEPGRFLVAESGVYVAQVLYRKHCGDKQFAVVEGGMHHNYLLAGGMGQVIRRNFQMDVLPNPDLPAPEAAAFDLDVAGCLCTPQDVLAVKHPCQQAVRPGDYAVFFNCGAYGLSASPTAFLSHAPAGQYLL